MEKLMTWHLYLGSVAFGDVDFLEIHGFSWKTDDGRCGGKAIYGVDVFCV